ncbi:DUF6864 domain-containing function [Bradyrhizobium sp. Cp5.3]|uniref:DUF6864 domain-containing function n=1 Tax=Bradyrhizobium sp. Cp5.3 TaxID=443598 RepID=UPI0004892CA1|nr:hypothetical protein [Bradyrhizobium sp. Cp5.3]
MGLGRVKVGDREVVGSGAIVTHPGDKFIEFSYENLNYRIVFDTKPPEANKGPSIDFEIVDDWLEIRLTNFDNSLGSSWSGEVGNIGPDQKLDLSFSLHTIGYGDNLSRTVSFTFTLKGDD